MFGAVKKSDFSLTSTSVFVTRSFPSRVTSLERSARFVFVSVVLRRIYLKRAAFRGSVVDLKVVHLDGETTHRPGDPMISNCGVRDEFCALPVFWRIKHGPFQRPEATHPADVEINFGAKEGRIVALLSDWRAVHLDDLLLRIYLKRAKFLGPVVDLKVVHLDGETTHSAGDPKISNYEVWDEVCVLPIFWWIARLALGGPEATRPANVEINFGAEECRAMTGEWYISTTCSFVSVFLGSRSLCSAR